MKLFLRALTRRDYLRLFLSLLVMILGTALAMKAPAYTQEITQEISRGTATMELVRHNGWVVFYLELGGAFLAVINGILCSRLSASFGASMRGLVFDRACALHSGDVDRLTVGSLITRTNSDVTVMQLLLLSFLQVGIQTPLTVVWAITKIRNTNTAWTGSMVLCIVVLSVLLILVMLVTYPKVRRLRLCDDAYNTVVRQGLAGVRVIRAFRADAFQEGKNETVNRNLRDTSFATNRLINILSPSVSLCNGALSLAIYCIGAFLMVKVGGASRANIIGNMTAFSQYSAQIVSAFTSAVALFALLPETLISYKRIKELFTTAPKVVYPSQETVTPRHDGAVELHRVTYSHEGAAVPCLQDIDLTVQPGERLVITGPTGCGKTTLLYVIRRLLAQDSGQVLLSGNDSSAYTEEQLSQIVSAAPQRATLFSETVRFNLCYGEEPDEARLAQVLSDAQIDFLDEKGADMTIDQGGVNFSGGQRQRLCLARALYRKAQIYLLDDPFSALDVNTEHRVWEALSRDYADATLLIVSQRISTLRLADRVAVMNDGRLIDVGSHQELLARCPFYREFVQSQKAEEVLA